MAGPGRADWLPALRVLPETSPRLSGQLPDPSLGHEGAGGERLHQARNSAHATADLHSEADQPNAARPAEG